MRFTFVQAEMVKGLQKVMGGVPTKMPMPALSNLHLKLEGSRLEIVSTDLEITLTASIPLVESSGSGSVLIQARRFQELIRVLPDVSLEIEIQDPLKVILKGEDVGTFNLPAGDPIDFPELPQVDAQLRFEFDSEILKRMINKTLFAVSHDEMRPILTGFLVQIRAGEIRLVSTDGHRLSKIVRRNIEYTGDNKDVVVPTKALSMVMRNMSDDVKTSIGIADTRASFDCDDYHITTRLIDGNYPKYESVIPESNPARMTVKTDDLMAAVSRAAIFTNQMSRQVKLVIDKTQMSLESEDPELGGKAEVSVPVDYDGESLEIAYNATYLLELLKQIDTEEVIFELGSSNDAAIVRPTSQQDEDEDFFMLIMPIRLR